jgi:hypothetical protein
MDWETGSEGPLLVSARVTHIRGALRVERVLSRDAH